MTNEEKKYLHSASGFSIPGQFFDSSARALQNRIEWNEEISGYRQLSQLRNEAVYSMPDHYTGETGETLFALLKLEALKKNVFDVPPGYFEDAAPLRLIRPYKTLPQAKTRRPGQIKRSWIFKAAAAILVSAGAWLLSSVLTNKNQDCGGVACLDRHEIIKSRSIENLEQEDLYELVDPELLHENLEPGNLHGQPVKKNDSAAKPARPNREDV